jgi:UDP-glucose 4-epimerase
LALQDKDIMVYGDGKQLRNVLYVDDAVEALVLAAEMENTNGETFFAVGDHHYSVAMIAEKTVKYLNKGRVRYIPWPKGLKSIEIGDAVINNAKIKNYIDWSPKCSLEEGLEKTKEYYELCLSKYV